MGFFDFLRRPAALLDAPRIVSPYSPPSDSITTLLVSQLYPQHDTALTLTTDVALRIPAVKRAHDVTCGILARMPWRQFDGDVEVATQPRWLTTTKSGISPRDLRWGVASDLFLHGWYALGFELENDLPVDAVHIPVGMWGLDEHGEPIVIDPRVPIRYRQRVIIGRLGHNSNGLLIDGYETLTDARAIGTAYRDRIDNPIAQTILSVAADRWDGWNREEREEFRQLWIKGRKSENGATAMKPDWVTVDTAAAASALNLFETGRNANRLDIANHAGLPASILEGSKQSGGGDIHYSTEAGGAQRNELWDTGLAKYADAIDGRLSLDDVCPEGQSIRVDASAYLSTPHPTGPIYSED